MRYIGRALNVFRPLNLLMIACFQWAIYYYLNFDAEFSDLLDARFYLMLSGILCITAAGYAINDYCDRAVDEANRPGTNHVGLWPQSVYLTVYLALNAFGIWLTWHVSFVAALCLLVIAILLCLYSVLLQKWPIVGNLVVAACTSFAIWEVYLVFNTQHFALIVFFTLMAFLLTLARELAKDMEDVYGDQLAGYRTYPVLVGNSGASRFLRGILLFTLVFYVLIQYQYIRHMFSGSMLYVYYVYQLTCVLAPWQYLIYLSSLSGDREHYHKQSYWLKILMATGIASVLLF
ncbi:MAG: geranylgeranylglycerol-phosphate geranylgeranyltransferase [Flavobacteriales bacterium]|nr:geranylgeranylglycerol-phosphate geranylgeranyltransferase [Flavobacteriales bacterium]